MIYLDSSALLKLVIPEPESAALFEYLDTAHERYVANIQRKLDARNRVSIAVWAWDTGHATPR